MAAYLRGHPEFTFLLHDPGLDDLIVAVRGAEADSTGVLKPGLCVDATRAGS